MHYHVRVLQSRVLERARQALAPLGQWPRCKSLIPATHIAHRLAGTCPGDPRDYEVDHTEPLTSFDLRDDMQVVTAFAATNHQWSAIDA